jgi:pimeloyl-ACP methyl ester carboxylesterase
MRGEFVDLDGVRLYCYAFGQRGAGHPLVLVHGAFTSSHLWQDVLPRLPKGHRVLVLDLLGHGRSDPPGRHAMTVAAHAKRLAQLLDVMGVRQAMLVGHGMGAAIAARVAHEQPERVAHLMCINPLLLAATPPDALIPRRLRRLAWLLPLWRRLAPGWLASALHSALLPCFAHRDVGARSLDVYLKPFQLRDGRDAACAQLAALAASRADTVTSLAPAAIQCPTALVLGASDPLLAGGRAERVAAALQQATNGRLTTVTLPGAAHVAPEEAPDRLGTAVAELLTL